MSSALKLNLDYFLIKNQDLLSESSKSQNSRSYPLAIERHHLTSVFGENLLVRKKSYLSHGAKPGFTVRKIVRK